MTGERYFSKVAVHPFQPPSFFTTADYADYTDKRIGGDRTDYCFKHSLIDPCDPRFDVRSIDC